MQGLIGSTNETFLRIQNSPSPQECGGDFLISSHTIIVTNIINYGLKPTTSQAQIYSKMTKNWEISRMKQWKTHNCLVQLFPKLHTPQPFHRTSLFALKNLLLGSVHLLAIISITANTIPYDSKVDPHRRAETMKYPIIWLMNAVQIEVNKYLNGILYIYSH